MIDELDMHTRITCPQCKRREAVPMPVDRHVTEHTCTACGHRLTTPEGVCCVFCAHGTCPCPPVQALTNGNCCSQ